MSTQTFETFPILASHDLNIAGHVSTTGRKQNKSCDQCRKGKRACDADSVAASIGTGCSNCQRTNKQCTFEWLKAQRESIPTRLKRTRDSKPKSSNDDTSPISSLSFQSDRGFPIPDDVLSSVESDLNGGITTSNHSWTVASKLGNESRSLEAPGYIDETFNESLDSAETSLSFPVLDHVTSASLLDDDAAVWPQQLLDLDHTQAGSSIHHAEPNVYLGQYLEEAPESGPLPQPRKRKRRRSLYKSSPRNPQMPSIFSSNELHLALNGNMVSQNLMKIYHDSMENALSCWLTERTCPYGTRTLIQGVSVTDASLLSEWGPDWSNRIYQRIFRLDGLLGRLQGTKVSKRDDASATRALHLAILSFASQWAQRSQRDRVKYRNGDSFSPLHPRSGQDIGGGSFEQHDSPEEPEFDRVIQQSTWHEARRALQDAADIESFRVAFAQIIFSLTQRPLEADQSTPKSFEEEMSGSEFLAETTFPFDAGAFQPKPSKLSDLEEVIDQDEAPLFLEYGLRHVHTMRSKIDRLERERPAESLGNTFGATVLDSKDRKTIDLLYWLGVMFDTLSACMHNRPLVVSDEDSELTPVTDENLGSPMFSTPNAGLWGDHFYRIQAPLDASHEPARWPCSYNSAARVLTDAAPIKVLLFRKVTRLQTLLSRKATHEAFEAAISEAFRVYEYWNRVYRPFFMDCVSNHEDLPHRIQSWYVCLAGHWYLATLLLADAIEVIDIGSWGLEGHRMRRTFMKLVPSLRRSNAVALSDLARVSTPDTGETSSFSRGRGWHDSVNTGALLTEPWTAVLIRAFVKATRLILDGVSNLESEDVASDLQRCDHCAKALWYLGKKSDVALSAARTVMEAIGQKRLCFSVPGTFSGADALSTSF